MGTVSDHNYDIEPTVLIVDDVPENLQVLGKMLDEHGIEFSYATSGREALEAVDFHAPDLILLDVNMPGMTGYEVCETLKSKDDTKDIPVIFLTAQSDQEDIIKGLDLGGIDYITKPFNSRELITRVKSHLELSVSKKIMKLQNEQLSTLNQDLQEALATRNKFFSIIAHDLKDPFNTLIGFSDILIQRKDEVASEETREILQHIYNSSMYGFELLNNLLEWSRAQTGRLKYQPEPLDLESLIQDMVNLLRGTAEKKGITLSVQGEEDMVVLADRKMIETVVRNLASNALKFTSAGGNVTIQYDCKDGMANISVKDDGQGMDQEQQAKLFSLTESYSTPGTENEKGTGLGLILCKEFITKNEGEISVWSEVGKGSVFTVSLPCLRYNTIGQRTSYMLNARAK